MTPVSTWTVILASRLTRYDQRQRTPNPYRLSHYLGAVQKVDADCAGVADRGDPAAMTVLLRSLDARFCDLPPVDRLKAEISDYVKTGKAPKL